MHENGKWIALLTEDEDDFAYWQFGLKKWAPNFRVEWFATGDAFFVRPDLVASKPALLLLDGLIPSDEESNWLAKVLRHECCQGLAVVMLSDHFLDDQQKLYMELGAAACIIKPTIQAELQIAIQTVSQYAKG